MGMVFDWRDGARFSGSAQEVGEAFERIQETQPLTPSVVFDEAHAEDSPLHDYFEWDESVAARLHNEEIARGLIRSVVRIEVADDGESEVPVQAYIHVRPQDGEPCYMSSARVMSDEELRVQAIAEALSLLRGVQKRFNHLNELKGIFDRAAEEIERIQSEKAAKPKRTRRRKNPLPVG